LAPQLPFNPLEDTLLPHSDEKFLFTSESVTEGHPDKIADQISDAVLDAVLTDDPAGRVACETLVTTGLVVVAGEITTTTYVDFSDLAREVIRDVGYTRAKFGFDAETCGVICAIKKQSPDIAMGVDTGGAGDQGLMFGFACDETPELMPMPIQLAHQLTHKLAEVRKKEVVDFLRPDGKSQVTIEYIDGRPARVDAVVISTQHSEKVSHSDLEAKPSSSTSSSPFFRLPCSTRTPNTTSTPPAASSPAVPWATPASPAARSSWTLMAATAATAAALFPERIPPRLTVPPATWRATSRRISSPRASPRKVEVQLAYAIGVAEPVSVMADTFGTGTIPNAQITELIRAFFKLTPKGIIETLDLRRPIFRPTAAYGHFGRTGPGFTWERTDKAEALRKEGWLARCGAASRS
jgi:S-adenosylmethionine synthetase